jgi:hypothetical protein
MNQFKLPCSECGDDGLVHAIKTGTHDRYIFKCPCIFGQSRSQDFPVWMKPTKGFVLYEVSIPNQTKISKEEAIGKIVSLVSSSEIDPFDE